MTLIDSQELAEKLKISYALVRKLLSTDPSKLPPHIKFGNRIRFCDEVVDQWIREKNSSEN